MKAVCWHGAKDVRVDTVPDPKILNPRDAIIKITSTAICGSDLHLYDGFIPTMQSGDILGHEFMGEVVEVGNGVKNLKIGDRVVVPFTISCGSCFFVSAICGRFAITLTQMVGWQKNSTVILLRDFLATLIYLAAMQEDRQNMLAFPLLMSGRLRFLMG